MPVGLNIVLLLLFPCDELSIFFGTFPCFGGFFTNYQANYKFIAKEQTLTCHNFKTTELALSMTAHLVYLIQGFV